MPTSDSDIKMLWGRAAGICSNPTCCEDLIPLLISNNKLYNIGEMAHIIARQPSGPRGVQQGGSDSYDNLILLCPTCHRLIDKGPSDYPPDRLLSWKAQHEARYRNASNILACSDITVLKDHVRRLLYENKLIWKSLGPQSAIAIADPSSNLCSLWTIKKLTAIIPNNKKIVNLISANENLLDRDDFEAYLAFKIHESAFELHQYQRLEHYPMFPSSFEERFNEPHL